MCDCKEEQLGEIEAIGSIYSEELEVLETDPFHVFTISLRSQESNDVEREQDEVACVLQFTYTENYPNEVPLMEIESDSLEEERIEELNALMSEQAEENLGMLMVFTITAAVLDKLNEYFDENTKRRLDAVELAKNLAEEAERKKFEGTRCTVENFMAWKLKFDAERLELKKKSEINAIDTTKPTGYDLFMKDKTLDDSDLKFLDEEDVAAVNVDESLFDDLDDLDIDEELEEET